MYDSTTETVEYLERALDAMDGIIEAYQILLEKNEKMKKALLFYAAKENWSHLASGAYIDEGEIARKALENAK